MSFLKSEEHITSNIERKVHKYEDLPDHPSILGLKSVNEIKPGEMVAFFNSQIPGYLRSIFEKMLTVHALKMLCNPSFQHFSNEVNADIGCIFKSVNDGFKREYQIPSTDDLPINSTDREISKLFAEASIQDMEDMGFTKYKTDRIAGMRRGAFLMLVPEFWGPLIPVGYPMWTVFGHRRTWDVMSTDRIDPGILINGILKIETEENHG